MAKKTKGEEVADKANASPSTEETTDSKQETQEPSTEEKGDKVETPAPKEEDIKSDYLGEPKEEIDYKKRYGDSTREYQKLKEESGQTTQALKQLEELAAKNPKILAEIEAAQQLVNQSAQVQDSYSVQQQINTALEPVKRVTQEIQNKDRLTRIKTLTAFEKKNPDLFSPQATAEEKKAIRQKVGGVANVLAESGMNYSEALDRAYLTINPKAAIQKGKDEAYAEGYGETQAGFSSQTSTEGKSPKKKSYTPGELEAAAAMGVKLG
jgi:hypothetical protein